MKKWSLLLLFLISSAYAAQCSTIEGNGQPEAALDLPASYQQFKHQFLLNENMPENARPFSSFKGNDDFTMLYVAGGLFVITGGLAYANGYNHSDGFFSPDNTGLIIGGSLSTAILLTKFFIDRYRHP
jgi:hypothetical protein